MTSGSRRPLADEKVGVSAEQVKVLPVANYDDGRKCDGDGS